MGFDILRRGNTVLDSTALQVWARSGVSVTGSEAVVLRALFADPGTVRRDVLLGMLCSGRGDGGPDTKTIDILVMRLRRKLRDAGSDVAIVAVRGLGFRLDASAAERLTLVPLELLQRACAEAAPGSAVYADLTAAIHAAGGSHVH